jgi:hypothetical protein
MPLLKMKLTTNMKTILWLLPLLASTAFAQDVKIPPNIENLSAKAKETVEVTMDGPMLRWASKFLSADDPDEEKAAKLVANLKGIYVRSYEFDTDGAYPMADVDALRAQFHSPTWSRVVGVRSEHDGDNVDVYFKMENDKMAGIVVIAAEARELTVVSIEGPLEVEQLADLGGEFGVPKFDRKSLKHAAKAEKDKTDKDKTDKGSDKDKSDKDKEEQK